MTLSESDYKALEEDGIIWAGKSLPSTTMKKTNWMCAACDYNWIARYNDVYRSAGCPRCAGILPKNAYDYGLLAEERGWLWTGKKVPKNTSTITNWRCCVCNTARTTTYKTISNFGLFCKTCKIRR